MANVAISSQRLRPETSVVSLTLVRRALWQLGTPILDAEGVSSYRKRAKRGMLWRAIRWQVLGVAALVAFMCIGHQWGRVAAVSAAAVALTTLFGWLVRSDLQWLTADYSTYQREHPVPAHVSAAANALLACGVPQERIGVEYLKADPILFVEDAEARPEIKRYDLLIW